MADGYMGKFLVADLTTQTAYPVMVPEWLKTDYVGGKGFGAALLWEITPKGTDPLGPDNVLMFMTGPLTATAAPSMRACVVTKSPLTGLYLDSYFGGRFGPEIKYAGYDGLIIFGKASEPTILWICDDKIEFKSAKEIWGLDTIETNRRVKKALGEPGAVVAAIGQAGEHQVLYSLISCEPNRQAGRGGAGAVMGSKNLKAVAIKGSRLVRVNDLEGFKAACRKACDEILNSETCQALTDSGTSNAVPWSSEVGTLPYKNFFEQVNPKADRLGDVGQKKHLFLGKAACFGCPIRCSQMGAVRTGKFAHLITDIVEYESAALMGSNLGIEDVRAVAHLVKMCDAYGLDSMSTGVVIGFAFEAAVNGVIRGPQGVGLDFGSVAGAEYLIKTIAFQADDMGRLFSQGVKRAALALGRGTERYAQHVKGLELPGWAPRGTPGMGLAYMTADRGGCHQRGFMVAYELGGKPYQGAPVDTYGLKGKAEILISEQNYLAGTDTLVKCDFGAFGVSAQTYAALMTSATGRCVTGEFWSSIGERIWNRTRLYNLREGLDPADDTLPGRIVDEPLPGGPHKGKCIRKADMAFMLQDYYRLRGWDENGRPAIETLDRMGLIQKQHLNLQPPPVT